LSTTDIINTVAGVVSAGVAVLTLVDQRRSRQPTEVDGSKPAQPIPATPANPTTTANPARPPSQVIPQAGREASAAAPGRSGKASLAVILGLWGLAVTYANRPGAPGGDTGDYVFGIIMSVASLPIAIWAIRNIQTKPGMRGLWLAVAGIAGGAAGVMVALLVR
jgi:hypothetical protein